MSEMWVWMIPKHVEKLRILGFTHGKLGFTYVRKLGLTEIIGSAKGDFNKL